MPIYTPPYPYEDHHRPPAYPHPIVPLHSSLGINPQLSRIIDESTKKWLDDHLVDMSNEIMASVRSFYKKDEATIVTTSEETEFITIPFDDYRAADILLVDVNGLDLSEGIDYERQFDKIKLKTPIVGIGEQIHLIAIRAVRIPSSDYSALRGEKGDKGDKGDTFKYEDLTEEQIAVFKGDMRAFYKKQEGVFVTTDVTTNHIDIPIDGYRPIDVLIVDINGLDIIEGTDYVVNKDSSITLSSPIDKPGTNVHFTSFRAVAVRPEDYDILKGDRGSDGEKGEKGDKGDKGERGESFTYNDLTEAQKSEIMSHFRCFYRKDEATITTDGPTSSMTIPFDWFDSSTDMLFVDVNGLDLSGEADYSIEGNIISFVRPISTSGVSVHFMAFRSIGIDPEGYDALRGEKGEKGDKGDKGDSGDSSNYNELQNKPSIESVTLTGNVTLDRLGIIETSNEEIDDIFSSGERI